MESIKREALIETMKRMGQAIATKQKFFTAMPPLIKALGNSLFDWWQKEGHRAAATHHDYEELVGYVKKESSIRVNEIAKLLKLVLIHFGLRSGMNREDFENYEKNLRSWKQNFGMPPPPGQDLALRESQAAPVLRQQVQSPAPARSTVTVERVHREMREDIQRVRIDTNGPAALGALSSRQVAGWATIETEGIVNQLHQIGPRYLELKNRLQELDGAILAIQTSLTATTKVRDKSMRTQLEDRIAESIGSDKLPAIAPLIIKLTEVYQDSQAIGSEVADQAAQLAELVTQRRQAQEDILAFLRESLTLHGFIDRLGQASSILQEYARLSEQGFSGELSTQLALPVALKERKVARKQQPRIEGVPVDEAVIASLEEHREMMEKWSPKAVYRLTTFDELTDDERTRHGAFERWARSNHMNLWRILVIRLRSASTNEATEAIKQLMVAAVDDAQEPIYGAVGRARIGATLVARIEAIFYPDGEFDPALLSNGTLAGLEVVHKRIVEVFGLVEQPKVTSKKKKK